MRQPRVVNVPSSSWVTVFCIACGILFPFFSTSIIWGDHSSLSAPASTICCYLLKEPGEQGLCRDGIGWKYRWGLHFLNPSVPSP